MKPHYICQTKQNRSYVILPDNWSGIIRVILSRIIDIGSVFTRPNEDLSLSKTILGPNGMFLHFNIRQLLQDETEPAIETVREYFEGLAYRQNYFEVATSTIQVLSKEHFTARYYRVNNSGVQYNKKYCLYIERLEYLITAVLANATKDQGRADESAISKNENIYDKIVRSLHFVKR